VLHWLSEEVGYLKLAWQPGQDTAGREPAYVAGFERLCEIPAREKSEETNWTFVNCVVFLHFSTGQYAEEGNCSAHSGEEGAVAGASEERWYYKSQAAFSLRQHSTTNV